MSGSTNYSRQDLRKLLNAAQYEAATTTEGPLLVIAGAGSGKTRVIEYRSLHLVQKGTDPESILQLEFPYTPPVGPLWHPLQQLARVAQKLIR